MVVFSKNNDIENEKVRHEIIKILNTTFEEEPVKVESDLYIKILASI